MGYYDKKHSKFAPLTMILGIAIIVIDILLVNALKDKTPLCRWLWLPILSVVFTAAAEGLLTLIDEKSSVATILGVFMGIWGVVRGLSVVIAYFKVASGIAILGPIFFCIIMWFLNGFSFTVAGFSKFMSDDAPKNSSPHKTATPPSKKPTSTYQSTQRIVHQI